MNKAPSVPPQPGLKFPPPEPKTPVFSKDLLGSGFAFLVFFSLCFVLSRLGWLGTSKLASLPVFVLVCHGLTAIITESAIAWPFSLLAGRVPIIGPGLYAKSPSGEDSGLLSCPLCTGMWVGAIMAALGIRAWEIGEGLGAMRDLVCHGLLSSGTCFAVHVIMKKLGSDKL